MYFNNLEEALEKREENSTYYIQFSKGTKGEIIPWKEDSLYIFGKTFDEVGLNRLFYDYLPGFDFYDNTRVVVENWNKVYEKSRNGDQHLIDAMDELKIWVDKCFEQNNSFMIIGI